MVDEVSKDEVARPVTEIGRVRDSFRPHCRQEQVVDVDERLVNLMDFVTHPHAYAPAALRLRDHCVIGPPSSMKLPRRPVNGIWR